MPTFTIVLAYDGTDYVGWQRQAVGTSIQGLLEAALREFEDRDVAVAGAGRTDAGVHALGQVASFALERPIDPPALVRALNAKLPAEVRVLSACERPAGFHARFDARAKIYQYRICNADVVLPFERRYVWHLPGPLDVEAMGRAAALLEGRHDFAAFQGAGSDTPTTERTITRSRIVHGGVAIDNPQSTIHNPQSPIHNPPSTLSYLIEGDGFLRHMVRAIVGSLVEVGRGRRAPEWLREVLASRDRARAGPTAPPEGLFLAAVDYVK
jgi:tRNA pseudouridine38-40 synthase